MLNRLTNPMNVIIFCLMIFLTMSCSESPQVKPDSKSVSQPDVPSIDADQERISYAMAAKKILHFLSINHIAVIELSCSYYHDAFGKMPDSPTDMLDAGFMLVWPGNTYQQGPIKLLDSPPDLSKPNDMGNIYYKRYDDHTASIFFLSLNFSESTDDNPVWKLVEMKIESATAAYALHPDSSDTDPYVIIGYQLKDLSKDELMRYGYQRNLSQTLSFIVNDSLKRTGQMDDSFGNMLIGGRYYLSKPGLQFLKNKVAKNETYFDMGKYADGLHVFYLCKEPDEDRDIECRKFNDSIGDIGKIEYNLDCPDSVESVSIFSSQNLQDIIFPDDCYLNQDNL